MLIVRVVICPPPSPMPGAIVRKLKARGQTLEASVFMGKAGFSDEFRRNLENELESRELVKVKFVAFKDQKKELSKQLAAATKSQLIMRVGNVAVLYRRQPDPARQKIKF